MYKDRIVMALVKVIGNSAHVNLWLQISNWNFNLRISVPRRVVNAAYLVGTWYYPPIPALLYKSFLKFPTTWIGFEGGFREIEEGRVGYGFF